MLLMFTVISKISSQIEALVLRSNAFWYTNNLKKNQIKFGGKLKYKVKCQIFMLFTFTHAHKNTHTHTSKRINPTPNQTIFSLP